MIAIGCHSGGLCRSRLRSTLARTAIEGANGGNGAKVLPSLALRANMDFANLDLARFNDRASGRLSAMEPPMDVLSLTIFRGPFFGPRIDLRFELRPSTLVT